MLSAVYNIFLFLTPLIGVLITYIPHNLFADGLYRPDICLALICYWVIRAPSTVWLSYLFLLGLVADTLATVTLGTHSMAYLFAWVITTYTFKQGIMKTIYGWLFNSLLIISFSYLLYWIERMIVIGGFVNPSIFALNGLITISISYVLIFFIVLKQRFGH